MMAKKTAGAYFDIKIDKREDYLLEMLCAKLGKNKSQIIVECIRRVIENAK
jgi:hypothetical protein